MDRCISDDGHYKDILRRNELGQSREGLHLIAVFLVITLGQFIEGTTTDFPVALLFS